MASPTSTSSVRFHRVLRCPPERVYRAFLDAEALVKWLPPDGFTARMHQQDAVAGGSYRMSFTHFASGHVHAFGGSYLELVPHERLRYTARFDDPQLPGEMQTTVTLTAVARGTEVSIVQEGIPAAIPADDCYLGWQDSLALLGRLVEESGPA
ncbi:SRPBCC family protein [Ramlibacter sp. MAHUQ-53]|uniref:SRPBCC family protein n=1 Tax=unclassified Ramlibacter TaxID=2617605 RepID=UPI00362BD4B0